MRKFAGDLVTEVPKIEVHLEGHLVRIEFDVGVAGKDRTVVVGEMIVMITGPVVAELHAHGADLSDGVFESAADG